MLVRIKTEAQMPPGNWREADSRYHFITLMDYLLGTEQDVTMEDGRFIIKISGGRWVLSPKHVTIINTKALALKEKLCKCRE